MDGDEHQDIERLGNPVDEAIAEAISTRIVEKLRDRVIPAEIPVDVARSIADHARGGSFYWMQSIPLAGPHAIGCHYTLTPAGLLHLDFRRADGSTFYRGTLGPPEAGP